MLRHNVIKSLVVPKGFASPIHTILQRSLTIQNAHLYPRKPSWQVDASEENATASSSGSDNKCLTEDASSGNSIVLKCRELLMATPDRTINTEDSDISYYAKFGLVRLDSDNVPQLIDSEFEISSDVNLVDEQYFGGIDSRNYDTTNCTESRILEESKSDSGEFIDRHYFGDSLDRDPEQVSSDTGIPVPNSKEDINKENLNYVDEVFFQDAPAEQSVTNGRKSHLNKSQVSERNIGDFERSLLDDDSDVDVHPFHSLSPYAKRLQSEVLLKYKEKMKTPEKVVRDLPSQKMNSPVGVTPKSLSVAEHGVGALDESVFDKDGSDTIHASKEWFSKDTAKIVARPGTAYDYAVKLRQEKKEKLLQETMEDGSVFSPKYKRIINSVLDLQQLSKYELEKKLNDWIIYNDYDVVGFSKPYGLRAHGGGEKRSHGIPTLTDLLPELCKILKADELHHIHRLDANTTGVLLFARSTSTAEKLRKMFKDHSLIKTYLAIVKNIPSLAHGLIDVPLKEGTVDGKVRMVPRPEIEGSNQRRVKGFKAVTKFKVLSTYNSAALLSAQPVTGVKHQIRAHLGLVLNCPILADHKYSSSSKMVPQKLSSDVLQRLGMKQSRVRDLPTMLHASSVFLPQFIDGKNLKISCPPPPHFTLTMKALKLTSAYARSNQKSFDYVDLAQPSLEVL